MKFFHSTKTLAMYRRGKNIYRKKWTTLLLFLAEVREDKQMPELDQDLARWSTQEPL